MNEDVRNRLAELRAEGKTWEDVAIVMYRETGVAKAADSWRKTLNRPIDKRRAGQDLVRDHANLKQGAAPADTAERLLALAKGKPKRLEAMAGALHVSDGELVGMIEALRDKGHELHAENGMVWLDTRVTDQCAEVQQPWDGRRTIRFLAVSDTHLCSKYQQLGYLNEAYDDAIDQCCDFAIHAGDLTDGFYQNRPGHIYEIFKFGFDEQLQYVVDNYPRRTKRDGTPFVTKIISGNHDHTHQKADGANLVKAFAKQRNDIEFLGDGFAKLWITPKCDVDIQHPGDGTAYALSYAMQKAIDALQGGEKPKLMCVGHHHKAFCASIRNIHAFEVPCLQAQTPWEKSKRIAAVVGWWIITVQVAADGTVERLTPELVQRYEMRKEDY